MLLASWSREWEMDRGDAGTETFEDFQRSNVSN